MSRNRVYYDDAQLKTLLDATGLSDEAIAPRVGVKRLQVYRAKTGVGVSQQLLFALVHLANNELKKKDRKYKPIDPRTLLLDPPELQKNLPASVS